MPRGIARGKDRDSGVKILLVHPGALWSTHDVWQGVATALEKAGVEVVQYAMDARISFAGSWLTKIYRDNGTKGKPHPADIIYLAGHGLVERALRHMVDWVLIIAGGYVHPDIVVLLRRARLKVAVLLTESPYANEDEALMAERCNVVWTNERTSVPFFEQFCKSVHYWQHAIDPGRHMPESNGDAAISHDVVFVGTGWIERQELLHDIDWTGIDFGLYGGWALMGSRNRLREHLRGAFITNSTTAELYRRAKIGLNLHRTSMGWGREVEHTKTAESLNPRCYELAACGCFFICDKRAELSDVFGGLVPTFETAREAGELLRYYLAHESERAWIAMLLPDKVREHTFDHRVAEMLKVLEANNGSL